MDNNNKNTFIAIGLMLLVWVVFTLLFPPTKTEPPTDQPPVAEESVQQEAASPDQSAVSSAPTSVVAPVVKAMEQELTVKTDLFNVVLTNIGARIKSIELNNYRVENTTDSDLVKIIDVDLPHEASLRLAGVNGLLLSPEAPYSMPAEKDVVLAGDEQRTLVFRSKTNDGLLVEKILTFHGNSYAIDVDIQVTNPGRVTTQGSLEFSLVKTVEESIEQDRLTFTGGATLINDEVKTLTIEDLKENSTSYGDSAVWSAYEDKYFISALVPLNNSLEKVRVQYEDARIENVVFLPFSAFNPGTTVKHSFMAYFGPRDISILELVNYDLARAIDFGFFSVIADPLLWFLNKINQYIGNYGVAIILLTVLIKILFWPLTHKSYASMKAMQKLQPEIAKIRERFKNDRTRQGQETMALYKKNRVNPMSGCLPMLIQIPVFFALYRVLYEAIELRHSPFALWITDLSAPDTLFSDLIGISFAIGPLPLIMGFTMFVQQRMTPSTMDPTQQKIFLMMPVIFTVLFLGFPSGLVLYWLINNLLTIVQQYYIHKTHS